LRRYLAIERALHARWGSIEFRRIALLVEDPRGERDLPLLSLSSRGVVTLRGESARQQPTDEYSERYWCVVPGELVVNPMWLIGGGIGVSRVAGAVSPDYRVYRLNEAFDSRYIHHLMRSAPYRDQYRLLVRAQTTFDRRITKADFGSIPIPTPPLLIQHAIADYLDRETALIDAIMESKRQMAELVEERWSAFRNERVLHACNPMTGTGTAPPGWQIRNLGATVTLQRGHDLPTDSRVAGEVPVISSGGVSGWHNRAACQPPGVITGRYGTIGDTHYVDVPYWPLNTTLFVSDFRRNAPRWVYHMLAALPLAVDAEKSAVTGINRNVIGALKVPVPPYLAQHQIALEIDAAQSRSEQIVTVLRTQIDLLLERREALVTGAVMGQLEIPGAA
jgi:type I restriction enzyme S subunit